MSGAELDDDEEEFEDGREDEDAKPVMSPPAEQPMSLTTHGRFGGSNGDAEPPSSPRPQSRDSEQSADLHKVSATIAGVLPPAYVLVLTCSVSGNKYCEHNSVEMSNGQKK